MAVPPAEVEVSPGLVVRLLEEQQPDLAHLPVAPAGEGWDNVLFRLGDDLVVRLPRHAAGEVLLRNEQRWLPVLAARLPLSVPVPVRTGVPSPTFPYAWSVCPWFPGTPGDLVDGMDVAATAHALGSFFGALHRPAPIDAPTNPLRSPDRLTGDVEFEARCARLPVQVDVAALRAVWRGAQDAAPAPGPASWIHGDPHPANMVFAGGVPLAVLDFGDVSAGDPATDLSAAWMLLPTVALPTFLAAYGGADEDLMARARGWAALMGLLFLEAGRRDRPSYLAIGRSTLDRLVGGPASRTHDRTSGTR